MSTGLLCRPIISIQETQALLARVEPRYDESLREVADVAQVERYNVIGLRYEDKIAAERMGNSGLAEYVGVSAGAIAYYHDRPVNEDSDPRYRG